MVLNLSLSLSLSLQAVQQVLSNLLIAHIELRGEDSLDVRPYIHERKVEKIVVPLEGEILEIRNIFKRVSEPYRSLTLLHICVYR